VFTATIRDAQRVRRGEESVQFGECMPVVGPLFADDPLKVPITASAGGL
jgi:hypothetical protein